MITYLAPVALGIGGFVLGGISLYRVFVRRTSSGAVTVVLLVVAGLLSLSALLGAWPQEPLRPGTWKYGFTFGTQMLAGSGIGLVLGLVPVMILHVVQTRRAQSS